jgi:hypothetical protein
MSQFRSGLLFASMSMLIALCVSSLAGERGEEIMAKVNQRFRGSDSRMILEMTLWDTARQKTFHKSIVMERKKFGPAYRSAYWVTAPEHEKKIALLLSEDRSPSGMWMYFPGTQSVTEIASRGFPALASDFSCEDLFEQVPLANFQFRLLGQERQGSLLLARVEMVPATDRLKSELGFTKSIGLVRQDIGMIVHADYFDEKGVIFKKFTAGEIGQVQGIWTAHRLIMENLRAQHSTEVRVLDEDHSRISNTDFSPETLGASFDRVTIASRKTGR